MTVLHYLPSLDAPPLCDVQGPFHATLVRASATCPRCLAQLSPQVSEKAVMQTLRRVALAAGYLFYHTYSSKRSEPGWPDCAVVHPTGPDTTLYLLECKREGEYTTLAQARWLAALGRVTRVEAGVVWPHTLPEWLARWREDTP
jgi:hypothetical protein